MGHEKEQLEPKGHKAFQTAVDMPVNRNDLFLTVSSEKSDREHLFVITSKETGREIRTIKRGLYPKKITKEPVVPFVLRHLKSKVKSFLM